MITGIAKSQLTAPKTKGVGVGGGVSVGVGIGVDVDEGVGETPATKFAGSIRAGCSA